MLKDESNSKDKIGNSSKNKEIEKEKEELKWLNLEVDEEYSIIQEGNEVPFSLLCWILCTKVIVFDFYILYIYECNL